MPHPRHAPIATTKLIRTAALIALALACGAVASAASQAPTDFAYTLATSARTSAGVYLADGTLVRTLWSGVQKPAGTHTANWDGKLDDLVTAAPVERYHLEVVSNTITPEWRGVIGNTSDALTGPTVHRTFLPWMDMCIVGDAAYVCADFAERSGSVTRIDLKDPQKKHDLFPDGMVQQTTNRVCSDGVRLYMGGMETQTGSTSYVAAVDLSTYTLGHIYGHDMQDYLPFQGESAKTFGGQYPACNVLANSGRITGMAVQTKGRYLFVSRTAHDTVDVVDKVSGAAVTTLKISAPSLLAIDGPDHLWIAHGAKVERFAVDAATGVLKSSGPAIEGFTLVQGLAVHGGTVAVADAGRFHQVRAYSTTTGAPSWVLGRESSYATDAEVFDDKFYFTDARHGAGTASFIALQSDGTLWVGDKGNYRYQRFDAARKYVGQIAFMPHCWSSYVDGNDPTRVFADYLEYRVDYAKPLQLGNANGMWKLVRNWGANITANQDGDHDRLKNVATLSNGRTYAQQHHGPAYQAWEIVELVKGGTLRFTGVTIPRYDGYQLRPDGSVIGITYPADGVFRWQRAELEGFDDAHNPRWGAYTPLSVVSYVGGDPNPTGDTIRPAEITGTGIIASFQGGLGGGYHLGGVKIGSDRFLWKTAKTITTKSGEGFPTDGSYDNGQSEFSPYAGSTALAVDRLIVWGYRGEGWAGSQTNIWNMVYDNGLFLGQFGRIADQSTYPPPQAQPEMAGNAFCPSLVTVDGRYFLWHNDESYHGGLHLWEITGMDSIQVQVVEAATR